MKLELRFWSILPELGARILGVGLLGAAYPAQLQAQPVLDILLRPAPAEEVVLNWSTVSGRRYAVWSTTDLNLRWVQLTPAAGSLTAGSNQLALTASRQASQQFFQVAETGSPYNPAWDAAPVQRTIRFTNNPATTTSQNGLRLKNAIQALVPGDSLEIAAGTYSFDSYTALDPQGTAEAPIWIRAVPGATVVITRPDANQNIVNIGAGRQARYVCFRGLEFTGGSHGVRLYDCTQVWVDQCRARRSGRRETHDAAHGWLLSLTRRCLGPSPVGKQPAQPKSTSQPKRRIIAVTTPRNRRRTNRLPRRMARRAPTNEPRMLQAAIGTA